MFRGEERGAFAAGRALLALCPLGHTAASKLPAKGVAENCPRCKVAAGKPSAGPGRYAAHWQLPCLDRASCSRQ